jgi:hypothetical protein
VLPTLALTLLTGQVRAQQAFTFTKDNDPRKSY